MSADNRPESGSSGCDKPSRFFKAVLALVQKTLSHLVLDAMIAVSTTLFLLSSEKLSAGTAVADTTVFSSASIPITILARGNHWMLLLLNASVDNCNPMGEFCG